MVNDGLIKNGRKSLVIKRWKSKINKDTTNKTATKRRKYKMQKTGETRMTENGYKVKSDEEVCSKMKEN